MNLIKKNAYLLLAVMASSLILSCSSPQTEKAHTITTGSASLVVDETLLPIIEDQLAVFKHTYEDASIELISKPEKLAVDHLLSDSSKIAVLARELSAEEIETFRSKNIVPRISKFATDGIAVINNIRSRDSLISLDEIINVLKGKASSIESLVFDNSNSSTIRLLKDLAGVDELPIAGVYALNSNAEIIKYISENSHAFGIIGINWLVQPPVELKDVIRNVRVLGVRGSEEVGDSSFYKPSQTNLALGKYPLARDLYIIDCQGIRGLGLGFTAFLKGERGQRIILKSGLLPDSIPPREINIRNKLN